MTGDIQSIHDVPVLRLLHDHGAIPLQAVAHYLRGRHGRDESHLLQCVRQLEARGLLTRTPIGQNRGRASRLALELTREGYRWLGMPAMPNPYGRGEHPRDYQIARATAMLYYLSRGCHLARGADVYEALRGQAVTTIRAGHDRAAKGLRLSLLKKVAAYDMKIEALVAPDGTTALLIPVYRGLSWTGVLGRLTMSRPVGGALRDDPNKRSALLQTAAIHPLRFLLVAPDWDGEKAAVRGVQRWAKKLRLPAVVQTAPRHVLVGFPHEQVRPSLFPPRQTPDARG